MRTRSCCGWIIPVASLLLLTGVGCDDRRGDRVRVIERGHVCGPACRDHYYDGRTVVVAQRHIHGPGCGHRWDGGNWVIVSGRPLRPSGHVCTINCNHHYGNDGRVVEVRGRDRHVHGRNCGHEYDGHRWVIAGQVRRDDDRGRRIDRDNDDRGRGRRIERDDDRGRDRDRDRDRERDRDDRRGRR